MSHYKLTYLRNVRARAETPKMLFEMAGQDYEFCQFSRDEWQNIKHLKSPFGQLPTLDVDGMQFCQSKCIERFLAKRFGLYGKTDLEQAKADMVVDCLEDMRLGMKDIKWGVEGQKADLRQKYENEKAEQYFTNLEKFISKSGYVNGQSLSWPDLAVYNIINYGKESAGLNLDPFIKKCANITSLFANVENHPKIAEYLKKRPQVPEKF